MVLPLPMRIVGVTQQNGLELFFHQKHIIGFLHLSIKLKKFPKRLVFYLEKPENLKKALLTLNGGISSKVIVMMGAGDIVNHTNLLLRGNA